MNVWEDVSVQVIEYLSSLLIVCAMIIHNIKYTARASSSDHQKATTTRGFLSHNLIEAWVEYQKKDGISITLSLGNLVL